MSYSIQKATLIADQLQRLATQNTHQLAGQVANLDFWLAEAVHAIATIDQYPERFQRLRVAQVGWAKAHGTRVSGYCAHCGGGCEFGPQVPDPPRRIPAEDLAAARAAVRQTGRLYLLRLYRAQLIDESAVRRACDDLGAPLESEDLVAG